MKLLRTTVVLASLVVTTSVLVAQERQRASPHETVNATVDGNDITIVYGRPYTKDPKSGEKRKVWGTLVPYGKVWRMGADEATLLTTKQPIQIGDAAPLPAGTYSLYMLPDENSPKLIVNKQTGQWGTKYDEAQDVVLVALTKAPLEPAADQFTIAIDRKESGGVLKLMWENTQFSGPITVKK